MTDESALERARAIVRDNVDTGYLVDEVDAEDHFSTAGISSGDIIRIAQGCEAELGRALTEDELVGLQSVADIAALLQGAKAS